MTKQTNSFMSLGGSPAGSKIFRMSTLTLATILAAGMSAAAQNQTDTQTPVVPKVEKKPVAPPAEKTFGKYRVHESVELGGRLTDRSGSRAMWATMVNQSTGMRVLDHSLEMRTTDRTKTPFFDTLTSSSFGYGGDPNDVSTLHISKGRLYDFAGMFRRDRNYFDYNLFVNSLIGPLEYTYEPSSLHVYNTVRRNTDTTLTLFPLAPVHFRVGFNHGTHEGPSFSSVHQGGDVQVLQWFRNSSDTFTGGVDVNLARRTALSYDQFFVLYKGDSPYALAGPMFKAKDGTPASAGFNLLTTSTCGSGASKTLAIVGGVINPYCSQTIVQSQVAPTRTSFPTEQLRFASRYFDKVAMNGHLTYNGGISNVNHFNETFTGLLSRTNLRQEIDTGGFANGRLAHNKRVAVSGDYGIDAELTNRIAISDSVNFWSFRNVGGLNLVSQTWGSTSEPTHTVLTPIATLTPTVGGREDSQALSQKILGNTIVGSYTVMPQLKVSAGWRFNDREIKLDDDPTLAWHQNWLLLGTVFQPGQGTRITVNYDLMSSKSANSDTTANSYTREAPNRTHHIRGRATAKPKSWINFAVTGNAFWGKNTDPLVNHTEHNYDLSFATQLIARDNLSFDVAVSRDDVYSRTDLCYLYSLANAPYGDPASTGTCLQTADNPNGTLPTAALTSQLRLGNGYYSAPTTFFSGGVNYAPTRYLKLAGGARVNEVSGNAELLNPYTAYGALRSTILQPFADVQWAIAPQWTWHGNWDFREYNETDGGPAPRSFRGNIVTLGVKYAF